MVLRRNSGKREVKLVSDWLDIGTTLLVGICDAMKRPGHFGGVRCATIGEMLTLFSDTDDLVSYFSSYRFVQVPWVLFPIPHLSLSLGTPSQYWPTEATVKSQQPIVCISITVVMFVQSVLFISKLSLSQSLLVALNPLYFSAFFPYSTPLQYSKYQACLFKQRVGKQQALPYSMKIISHPSQIRT